jgi:aminoglycoside phosphotransferase (APT) family kinase protein
VLPAPLKRFLRRHRLRVSAPDTRRVWASRNLTLVCRAGARCVFVKAGGDRFEAAVLPLLGRAGVSVPRVFAASGEVLALEWVAGRTLFARRAVAAPCPDAALGLALARVHAADPSPLPLREALGDFGARIVWTSPEIYAALSPGALRLFSHVQRDLLATQRLAWLFEQERQSVQRLVHGDLRHANVLVSRGRPMLLDWEFAGLGDPARDLGMLIADDLAAWLVPGHSPRRLRAAEFRAHARATLRGYVAEARRLRLETGAAFPERIIGWTAEALLRRVHTVAQHEARFGDAEDYLVGVACALLQDPSRWARSYFGGAVR